MYVQGQHIQDLFYTIAVVSLCRNGEILIKATALLPVKPSTLIKPYM